MTASTIAKIRNTDELGKIAGLLASDNNTCMLARPRPMAVRARSMVDRARELASRRLSNDVTDASILSLPTAR